MAGFNPVYAGAGDNKLDVYGATDVAIWTITFGGSDTYTAGGLALVAATFGLSRPILAVEVIGANTAAFGVDWAWNSQTQKLQAEWTGAVLSAAFAEISGSIANWAITVRVTTQR
jgi:hypothetical protein